MKTWIMFMKVMLIFTLLFVVGCSKDDKDTVGNVNDDGDSVSTDEDGKTVNSSGNKDTDKTVDKEDPKDRIYKLGESASYQMFDQTFDITPTSFELVHKNNSYGKMISTYKHGVYLTLDITVENTGNTDIQTIDFIDHTNYYLLNNNKEGRITFPYSDTEMEDDRVLLIDRFEKGDVIKPNEKRTGQLIFETSLADDYTLGFGDLSKGYQTEAVWNIALTDAASIDENLPEANNDKKLLTLNETAELDYIHGGGITDSFQVTPTQVKVADEVSIEEGTITSNYPDEQIVIVTLKVKNIGDQPIDENLITGTVTQPVFLITDGEYRRVSRSEPRIYQVVNQDIGTIEPEDEVERTIYFITPKQSTYFLQFGSVYKVLYNNEEVIWDLKVSE